MTNFEDPIFQFLWNGPNIYIWIFCELCPICTQCINFRIFLSFRFYVKSILENLEVLKMPIFAILGALNFVDLLNCSIQKVQKCIKIKIQSLWMCQNGRFCTSRIPKIDFTQNLSDSKFMKFTHYDIYAFHEIHKN